MMEKAQKKNQVTIIKHKHGKNIHIPARHKYKCK